MNQKFFTPGGNGYLYLFFICLLNGCGLMLRPDGINKIDLERVFAPVRTYDCDGDLISEEIREVSAPSKWVRIYSEKDYPSIVSAEVSNSRLPDQGAPMISFSSKRYISLLVHYSNTFVGLQVAQGINELNYSLEHESFLNEENETGTITLDISYKEVHETEDRHYHPASETCVDEIETFLQ